MSKAVEVRLWGRTIGYLGYSDGQTEFATFEFDDSIMNTNIEISPLKMKNSQKYYQFDGLSTRSFKGLPGVIADSLPDKFGNQLIDAFMAQKGIKEDAITAIDRLMYVGTRSMGALEYHPSEKIEEFDGILDIGLLSELSENLLAKKKEFNYLLKDAPDYKAAITLLRIGSSAGGARAKALVSRDSSGKFYDGTVDHGAEHTYWMLKFDVSSNSDRDSKDPKGMTKIEYIYSLIAHKCGIDMPRTDYIELDEDFHFMIERFDRIKQGGLLYKLHYASWSGIAHAHRDETGAFSYEQFALVVKQLKLGQKTLEEVFRRAVFNIVGKNQDDHTKNFGFLMDATGEWRLSPAFDMTYSYDPNGKWTRTHQIKLNKKQDNFAREDLLEFGKFCNINQNRANKIIDSVLGAFEIFDDLAKQYCVDQELYETVKNNQRRGL